MRFAIVNNKDVVVSIVVWNNGSFKLPRDHRVIQSDSAQPRYTYNSVSKLFVPPVKL